MPGIRSFIVLPALPDSLKGLDTIARNMFWAWNPEFVGLFKRIDSKLWAACGHNPVKFLGSVSQKTLDQLALNSGFLSELRSAVEKFESYLHRATWFDNINQEATTPLIAYFSAEFGIHESVPIYAGGLGILAGDHLKSASDLGIPLVGIGLLYQKGYFRQYLNIDGWQQEVYAENDFYNMPIELVRQENGQPVIIDVEYPQGKVYSRVWAVDVGRVKLYLMDTNIEANSPEDRMITSSLYSGDREMRIRQEIMLGIGGLRALDAMGIKPTVCHMNEGHAAFMATERIRQLCERKNMSFEEALEATKAGNCFTVHTPVKAGCDEFSLELMDKYFGNYFPSLGISRQQFMGLGKTNPQNENEPFKMPVLALRLSSLKNGVSELHGQVSRKMWAGLWPNIPVSEVPITSITNGVHIGSWLSEDMNSLYERYLGLNWADNVADENNWKGIDQIPDEELWRTHQRCKIGLVAYARNRLKAQLQRRGTYHAELNWAEEVLDPEALTIGFARRFATYKRGNLLLREPQRLINILNDQKRPVQIIFAGKAHPKDTEGKEIIRQIIHFAAHYNVRRRIVFLEDYNIDVARILLAGVDIWLNTPRPPLEASGTSGMKAAINGALNLSTLDGWWCEGYKPDGGWTIGAGETYDDPAYQDIVESQAIYNMLEKEIVPLFYSRSTDNLPRAWISRIKNSIKWITPRFNTHRMVADYTRKFYIPAAAKWQSFAENDMARAKAFSAWKADISSSWEQLAIEDVKIEAISDKSTTTLDLKNPELKVGSELSVTALVAQGSISPDDIEVQIYHGPVDSWGDIMDGCAVKMDFQNSDADGRSIFAGKILCKDSGRQALAVRILPNHPDLSSPLGSGLILWETKTVKTEPVSVS